MKKGFVDPNYGGAPNPVFSWLKWLSYKKYNYRTLNKKFLMGIKNFLFNSFNYLWMIIINFVRFDQTYANRRGKVQGGWMRTDMCATRGAIQMGAGCIVLAQQGEKVYVKISINYIKNFY